MKACGKKWDQERGTDRRAKHTRNLRLCHSCFSFSVDIFCILPIESWENNFSTILGWEEESVEPVTVRKRRVKKRLTCSGSGSSSNIMRRFLRSRHIGNRSIAYKAWINKQLCFDVPFAVYSELFFLSLISFLRDISMLSHKLEVWTVVSPKRVWHHVRRIPLGSWEISSSLYESFCPIVLLWNSWIEELPRREKSSHTSFVSSFCLSYSSSCAALNGVASFWFGFNCKSFSLPL